MRKGLIVSLALILGQSALAEFRIWHDRKGNRLEAEYICEVGGKIMLRDPEGKEYRMSLDSLSRGDQAYLQRLLPPKLDIEFDKNQDRRNVDDYYSTLDIRCSAVIEKKSRMPYDRELKAIMVVLGYRDHNNQFVVLDRSESTFKLSEKATHEFSGAVFRINEYRHYYSTNRATKYRGHVIGVLDPEGKLVAVKASSTAYAEKFAELSKCRAGESLDRSLNKIGSIRSF